MLPLVGCSGYKKIFLQYNIIIRGLHDALCCHLQVAEYVRVEEEARKKRVRMKRCYSNWAYRLRGKP